MGIGDLRSWIRDPGSGKNLYRIQGSKKYWIPDSDPNSSWWTGFPHGFTFNNFDVGKDKFTFKEYLALKNYNSRTVSFSQESTNWFTGRNPAAAAAAPMSQRVGGRSYRPCSPLHSTRSSWWDTFNLRESEKCPGQVIVLPVLKASCGVCSHLHPHPYLFRQLRGTYTDIIKERRGLASAPF